jgi:hypothetical protein
MRDLDYLKKRFQEYCYDMDYNFYHNTRKELIPITRKEYKEKTGESDFIINKLRNSTCPLQITDYYFMRIEKKEVKYVPIDWALYNLIIYFNSEGFTTKGCNQIGEISKKSRKVSTIWFWKCGEGLLLFLKEKFGEIIVEIDNYHDFRTDGFNTSDKWWDETIYKDKIVFARQHVTDKKGEPFLEDSVTINFENKLIYKMSDVLGVEYPNHSNAHTGKRIIGKNLLERLQKMIL